MMEEPIKPGVYRISSEEYHSGPGISRSGLARILRSPLHYKTPQKETQPLIDGSAIHCAVFEPQRFEKEYVILPEDCKPGSGIGMKKRKELFEAIATHKGQIIINQNSMDMARRMSGVIHADQSCIDLLSDGEAEIVGYFKYPENPDILCKIKLDWLNKKKRAVVDLKTCVDARPERFISHAYDLNYHMQAAFYLFGLTEITGIVHMDFYFIAIEKEEPHGLCIYHADKEFIEDGFAECQRAIEVYEHCLKTNEWPCYEYGLTRMSLPEWVKRKRESYY